MSTPYELTGRTRQKARTRAALVEAVRELLAEGAAVTVEDAADRAGVARTTAYRYFANRRALLLATYPEIESSSLLPPTASGDPAERLEAVLESFTRQILEHEPELRAQLRLSLEPGADPRSLTVRQGRAIGWLEDALAPLRDRDGPEAARRLAIAIRATVGIEALVWLTDVADLSREDAIDLMRTSARTLLAAALDDSPTRA